MHLLPVFLKLNELLLVCRLVISYLRNHVVEMLPFIRGHLQVLILYRILWPSENPRFAWVPRVTILVFIVSWEVGRNSHSLDSVDVNRRPAVATVCVRVEFLNIDLVLHWDLLLMW